MQVHVKGKELAVNLVLNILGLLTVLPLAPLINRVIPPLFIGGFNADLLVAVLISLLLVRFILWIFKPLIVAAFLSVCVLLGFSVVTDTYNVRSMVQDYTNLVEQNWNSRDKKEKNLYLVKPSLFDSEVEKAVKGLKSRIQPTDSFVRNYAVSHSLDYFNQAYPQYGNSVRYLSLFRHINGQFQYVGDPDRDEYYATVRETVLNGMAGDCDDHTILMISCMRAIGAKCRMVLSVDHVYPELLCGDRTEFLQMQQAITDLFPEETLSGLYYREENGRYWINLDYSARHPGGPYADNRAYAVVEF